MEYCGIQIGYGVAVARMIRDDKESWFRDLHSAETVYDQTDNEFEMSKIAGRVNALTDVIATYPTIISKHLSGKHIYLSGPVTAIEDRNANTFSAAEAVLSLFGAVYIFDPVNSVDKDVPYEDAMTTCLQELSQPDYVKDKLHKYDILVSLPGWTKSKGATIERFCARACGIKVYDFFELLDLLKKDIENIKELSELLWGDGNDES